MHWLLPKIYFLTIQEPLDGHIYHIYWDFIIAVNPRGKYFLLALTFAILNAWNLGLLCSFLANAKFWISYWGMEFVNFIKTKTCLWGIHFLRWQECHVLESSPFIAYHMAQLSPMKTQLVRTNVIYSLVSEHGVPPRSKANTHNAAFAMQHWKEQWDFILFFWIS